MSRTILSRWRRPSRRDLEGVYPSGKPPFDPFPTVTELANAYYCPLAIYHYLHHGEVGAFSPRRAVEGWRAGDTFHEFIEYLKESIIEKKTELRANDDSLSKISKTRFAFLNFAHHLEKTDAFWQEYIEPWTKRKLDELADIDQNAKIYFEISIASNNVQFKTEDGGTHTYPLRGRIDEIDLDKKRIIDRTLQSSTAVKEYQLWILWKLLCSIDRANYPGKWQNIDFAEFELVVETPSQDVTVRKDNPSFERRTHDGYAWIHDLSFSPAAVSEAYNNRSCNIESRREDCGLSWMCYARKQPNPTCRDEMRRVFKDIYRAMLYERMWGSDIYQYRYLLLSEKELEERGLVYRGKIVSQTREQDTFHLELPSSQARLLKAKGSDDIERFQIIFGNLSIGKVYQATLDPAARDSFCVKASVNGRTPFAGDPLIAAVGRDFLVYEDRPIYLITGIQRDMHRLEYRGVKNEERAARDSKIQVIECIFGRRGIKRGGK